MKRLVPIAFALVPQLALAFEPVLPTGAKQMADEERPRTHYELPTGPFRDGALPTERVPGLVHLQAWRLEEQAEALKEIGEALASQLTSAGFDIVFHCETNDCGGFDFRFNTLVLPPPEMFVDLSHFRFISGRRDTQQGVEAVGIFLSRTSRAAMVQIADVAPMAPVLLDMQTSQDGNSEQGLTAPAPLMQEGAETGDLGETLLKRGHAILADLSFESGSANLAQGRYATLDELAAWLLEDSKRRVVLVGHTDSIGSQERNAELSLNRAKSVMAHLTNELGVPAGQLAAQGIGYLAPIATNETDEGREANRRVEAVLLPLVE